MSKLRGIKAGPHSGSPRRHHFYSIQFALEQLSARGFALQTTGLDEQASKACMAELPVSKGRLADLDGNLFVRQAVSRGRQKTFGKAN